METPLEQIRKERKELEEFRAAVMKEIHEDTVRLSDTCSEFDGYRDIKTWQASKESPYNIQQMGINKVMLEKQIEFKEGQLKDGITEVDKRFKDELKPKFIIETEIANLKLQLEAIDLQKSFVVKEQEIRDKKREQDLALIKKWGEKKEDGTGFNS